MSIGIAEDQAGGLMSPTRVRKNDLSWYLPWAAVTATAFAFDRPALNQVSINPAGIYTPLAAAGASWITGKIKHDDDLKETGFLARGIGRHVPVYHDGEVRSESRSSRSNRVISVLWRVLAERKILFRRGFLPVRTHRGSIRVRVRSCR